MEKKNYFAKSCFVAALTNVRLLRLAAIHEAATPAGKHRRRASANGLARTARPRRANGYWRRHSPLKTRYRSEVIKWMQDCQKNYTNTQYYTRIKCNKDKAFIS